MNIRGYWWSDGPGFHLPRYPDVELTEEEKREARWLTVRSVRLERELPFDMEVRIGRAADGHFVCTGLRLNHRTDRETEITAADLRGIRLPEIVKEAVRVLDAEDPAWQRFFLGYEIPKVAARAKRRAQPGPSGYDDAFYEEVAAKYREAVAREPRRPYEHFRRQFGKKPVAMSTARRWVLTARKKGMLGPTVRGKKGELALGNGVPSDDRGSLGDHMEPSDG